MTPATALQNGLAHVAARLGVVGPVSDVERLSGGASQETWAFAVGHRRLILRRAPPGATASTQGIGLSAEARVIRAARRSGVPAPEILLELEEADGLGSGYVMARLEGETIARRVLRDDAFATARDRLANDCGRALARIHATPLNELAQLPRAHARDQLGLYEHTYRSLGLDRPIFDLAFAALARRAPEPRHAVLVHGDFRLGNLMVQPCGLTAVLDWELAHIGEPAEDLGWICTPSWRFGQIDRPVGGFATLEDLLSSYREAGGADVQSADIAFWSLFSTLKWGVMCLSMYAVHASGADPSVERAMIGRRASETELDLVLMLQGKL